VKASGRDGFSFEQKAFNKHLPQNEASTCPRLWDNLPSETRKYLPRTLWEPAFGKDKHLLPQEGNNLPFLVLFLWLPVWVRTLLCMVTL
jgi:hypothetical protein